MKKVIFVSTIAAIILLFQNFASTNLISTKESNLYNIAQIFLKDSVEVRNSNWQQLPKSSKDFPYIPGKGYDYSQGGSFRNVEAGLFQNGQSHSSESLTVLPPNNLNDFLKIFFFPPSTPAMDKSSQWNLTATYGIRKAMGASQGVRVQIVVSGDKVDPSDLAWVVVDDFIVNNNDVFKRSTPLGTWPLRKNFYYAIQVSSNGSNNWYSNLIIDSPQLIKVSPRPLLGVAQSNLVWQDDYKSLIQRIGQQGSAILRTNMREGSTAEKFADIVQTARQNKMSVIATILQEPEDYDNPQLAFANNNEEFKKICGWSGGILRFSWISVYKYSQRFEKHLKALKNRNLFVDYFEIGNELDWLCFNGDITLGTHQSTKDLTAFIQKYALILEESKRLIQLYFPQSKLMTFATSNCYIFTSISCVSDPVSLLSSLQNVQGKNYLKLADAYAVHIYPSTDAIYEARNLLFNYANKLGTNKPFSITEWGFGTDQPQLRYEQFKKFIEYMNSTWSIKVDSLHLYTFSSNEGFSLMKNGQIDSSARIIKQYNDSLH